MTKPIGTLYLIPVPLTNPKQDAPDALAQLIPFSLPVEVLNILSRLKIFAVENARSARRLLKHCGLNHPINTLEMIEIGVAPSPPQIYQLLEHLKAGHSVGLLSEAGCPVVADPGQSLVYHAHHAKIPICPLVGPSAIVLALMASGLPGQRFNFLGYLSEQTHIRKTEIIRIEKESRSQGTTQIMIETPYRNQTLLTDLLEYLNSDTWLSVAVDLSLPSEMIQTYQVKYWRALPPPRGVPQRHLAMFLFYAGGLDKT